MTSANPSVLIVDDRPEEVRGLEDALSQLNTRCTRLDPGDVAAENLTDADLVLVDYSLEDWLKSIPARPIATHPRDGIALAGVFRQYSDDKAPPTGYALITGQPGVLGSLPAERRPHVISRLSNIEWFFEKQAPVSATANRVSELAQAIRSLPANVKHGLSSVDALARFLAADDTDPLYARYCNDVMRCRPPLHHLSERSHGLVIIRWLLHRILPHTCFLLDQLHLAARLRVQPASLEKCLSEEPLKGELTRFEYRGPLKLFDGRRWWRGGIEQWLWERTDGEAANDEKILQLLDTLGCHALVPADVPYPVVTVDENLQPEPRLTAFSDAIALRLDDWPDYAEPAYSTLDTITNHPEMRAFVSDAETT